MQHLNCKLIIFSNFYSILSCCLNLFFMSNMLFLYVYIIHHTYMYSSLYTCNCTVLGSSFFSENKQMLMLLKMLNVNSNLIKVRYRNMFENM